MKKLSNIICEMDEVQARQLAIDISVSLCEAHKNGRIHGNINVDHIILDDSGTYQLVGWGERSTYLDNYQAPEVYRGESCTISSDLYALGLVLYQIMNENRLPFYPTDVQTISSEEREYALKCRMTGAVLPAPSKAEYDLAKIILKACAYKEDERYCSAKEFLNEFIIDAELADMSEKNVTRFRLKKIFVYAALIIVGGLMAWGIAKHSKPDANQEDNSALGDTSGETNTEINTGTTTEDKEYEEFYVDGEDILVRKYPDEDGGWLEIRHDKEYNRLERNRYLADQSIGYQYPAEYDICEYQREMEYYQGSGKIASSSYERYYRDMGFEVWVSHEYADNTAAHYKYGILLSTDPDFEYEVTEYLVGISYEYDENYTVTGSDITFYYMGDHSVWQLTYDEAGRLDYVIHNIYDSEKNVTNSIIQLYSQDGKLVKSENSIGRKYRVVTQYNVDGSIKEWHESFLNEKGNAIKANRYIGIFERE